MPNFAFYKGSLIYEATDFATHVGGTSPLILLPMLVAHPLGSFVLSTPQALTRGIWLWSMVFAHVTRVSIECVVAWFMECLDHSG